MFLDMIRYLLYIHIERVGSSLEEQRSAEVPNGEPREVKVIRFVAILLGTETL
jgi:hypothetical protein